MSGFSLIFLTIGVILTAICVKYIIASYDAEKEPERCITAPCSGFAILQFLLAIIFW